MGIVLLTAVVLHYSGVISIGRRLILSLMFLVLLVTGLAVVFIMVVPYLNCILLRDHSIVEQPYKSENMTQRMIHEAVDFIERYVKLCCFAWIIPILSSDYRITI